METITLSKERHRLCTDTNNQPMYDPQGCLIIFDVIGKYIVICAF